jgi:hypothetical protein
MGAWAYKTAKPRFSVANERSSTALKVRAPIPADRLDIEDLDGSERCRAGERSNALLNAIEDGDKYALCVLKIVSWLRCRSVRPVKMLTN